MHISRRRMSWRRLRFPMASRETWLIPGLGRVIAVPPSRNTSLDIFQRICATESRRLVRWPLPQVKLGGRTAPSAPALRVHLRKWQRRFNVRLRRRFPRLRDAVSPLLPSLPKSALSQHLAPSQKQMWRWRTRCFGPFGRRSALLTKHKQLASSRPPHQYKRGIGNPAANLLTGLPP